MALSPLVLVDRYSGADFGAQVMAAHADLGALHGIIVAPHTTTTQTISTQIALQGAGGRRLVLGDGVYDNTMTDRVPILLGDDCEIVAARRWGASVYETVNRANAAGSTTAIADYASSVDNEQPGNQRVAVRGIVFLQKATDADGVSGTVQFGNVTDVIVEDCRWVDTSGFGVCIGGKATLGNHSSGIVIQNNRMSVACTQNIAVVNGYNVIVDKNIMVAGGAGGRDKSTFIDIELNSGSDRCENLHITNNIIDARGGVPGSAGSAIQVVGEVQDPGVKNAINGVIANNTVIGGVLDESSQPAISGGITLVLVNNMEIIGNVIDYIGQVGITLNGCDNCTVSNNRITDAGPTGIIPQTITLTGSRWCSVHDNKMPTERGGSYYAGVYEDPSVSYGVTCDYNEIYSNRLYFSPSQTITNPNHEFRITLSGPNSREWDNSINGQVWGGPAGADTIGSLTSGFIPGSRTGTAKALALVLGQSGRGDMQPMLFSYDPTDSSTADGITSSKPANNSGNGRWAPASQWLKLSATGVSGLTNPQAGLTVYDTTNNVLKTWNGTAWKTITWS